MSMKYYGDVCSTTGEYEKDGQIKKRSIKIGAAFQDDQTGRISIKLESLPMCKQDDKGYPCAWLSIFQNDNQPNNQANHAQPAPTMSNPTPQPSNNPQWQPPQMTNNSNLSDEDIPF